MKPDNNFRTVKKIKNIFRLYFKQKPLFAIKLSLVYLYGKYFAPKEILYEDGENYSNPSSNSL